jgi:ParB family transcriptional regulator, chromosome partitioning protein
MAKKNVLGRGLDALIERSEVDNNIRREPNEIPVELIEANPYQPRENFQEEALNELANSIKELGVIQPITVRIVEGKKFQLIAGERRLRASKIAGLKNIPAYIRTANDQELLLMALIENIQREDLDAIEIAISYQRSIQECNLTQDELSKRIGKKRATVSNYMRLLNLPAKIQAGIKNNKLSMGHARALLSLKDQDTMLMLFEQVLKYDFSVRKLEEIIREINADNQKENPKKTNKIRTPEEYNQLQKHLSQYFSTDVVFKRNTKGNGKIVIPFKNDVQLERIIAVLDKLNI